MQKDSTLTKARLFLEVVLLVYDLFRMPALSIHRDSLGQWALDVDPVSRRVRRARQQQEDGTGERQRTRAARRHALLKERSVRVK